MEDLGSTRSNRSKVGRFLALALPFWLVGVALAIFLGLGWFFVIQAFRRLILMIPPVRDWIGRSVLGAAAPRGDTDLGRRGADRTPIAFALQGLATVGWAILAALVLANFNVRLVDFIR